MCWITVSWFPIIWILQAWWFPVIPKVLACSSIFQLLHKEESKKICLCTDSPAPGLSPSLHHTWEWCLQDTRMLHGMVSSLCMFIFILLKKLILYSVVYLLFIIIKMSHKVLLCFIMSFSYIMDFVLYSYFLPCRPSPVFPVPYSWFLVWLLFLKKIWNFSVTFRKYRTLWLNLY